MPRRAVSNKKVVILVLVMKEKMQRDLGGRAEQSVLVLLLPLAPGSVVYGRYRQGLASRSIALVPLV